MDEIRNRIARSTLVFMGVVLFAAAVEPDPSWRDICLFVLSALAFGITEELRR